MWTRSLSQSQESLAIREFVIGAPGTLTRITSTVFAALEVQSTPTGLCRGLRSLRGTRAHTVPTPYVLTILPLEPLPGLAQGSLLSPCNLTTRKSTFTHPRAGLAGRLVPAVAPPLDSPGPSHRLWSLKHKRRDLSMFLSHALKRASCH
jgi:hypothetical protein